MFCFFAGAGGEGVGFTRAGVLEDEARAATNTGAGLGTVGALEEMATPFAVLEEGAGGHH